MAKRSETFNIPRVIAGYVKHVKKPTKHKPWQVILHTQGSYPRVIASFNTEKEANMRLRKFKKDLRKELL